MAVSISIESDVKRTIKQLDRIQRRQVPFALKQAINTTAFQVRNNTVNRVWRDSVRVKQRNFARVAFKVKKAGRGTRTEAEVYDSLGRPYIFNLQIRGGTRRPFKSSNLAIPTRSALTARGKIKKAARIDSGVNTFRATINGVEGIWQRYGRSLKSKRKGGQLVRRGGQRIRLLYTLKPRAQIDRAFPFYRKAEELARQKIQRNFAISLRKALRTAR